MVEGKTVRLEHDPGVGKDKYGRTPAYVYIAGEDEVLLNLEIIKQGYGFAYTRFPFSKMDEFHAAQKNAREARLGLWAESETVAGDNARNPGTRTRASAGEAHAGRTDCIPRSQCCRVYGKGQPCGNSCISRAYTCREAPGVCVRLCRTLP